MDIKDLIGRTITAVTVLGLCLLIISPNFLNQSLVLTFKETARNEAGEKYSIEPEVIRDFVNDRENGLKLYFPHSDCVPAADEKTPATHRCELEARFITSARVNELMQAHGQMLDENRSGVQPHGVERLFGFLTEVDYKNLKIKLGLDLQGGMRAIFRADFDSYLERLKEVNEVELAALKEKVARADTPAEELSQAQTDIRRLEETLNLGAARKEQLLNEAKAIIDKRLAAQGLTEPEVRAQPESFSISVDMPGVANSSEVMNRIQNTVTVEYRIVNDEATNRAQQDSNLGLLREIQLLYREGNPDKADVQELMDQISKNANITLDEGRLFLFWRRARGNSGSPMLPRELRVLGPPVMDGGDLKYAEAVPSGNSAWYMITFGLTETGSRKFGQVTEANVGNRMAILWGDRVVSDPNINEPIYGSQAQITGEFTKEQAGEIAGVIREGALPMPLDVLSVSFVGPSLGQESIIAGIVSIVLGFIVINAFMIGYYRLVGFVAIVALFLNLLIMGAIMSLLEFTLTLPGFAGAILTVGMAVDANVIIFEKMKEDLRAGKSASVAIESGFAASFWTILDANITTLIAAVILYLPKDGPIMGFAIVLFFGLVSSMFTSLFVSKLILDWSQYLLRYKKLSIGYGFN
ncbi:MAG: protein translocase subunit SecD [bacterium]|nr:protein translocase subunit SecD [bacterium]